MTDADEIGEISVWEGFDPDAAMQAAIALYGSRAVTAAAHCAWAAWCNNRETDYRFWFSIFLRLGGADFSILKHPQSDEDVAETMEEFMRPNATRH